MTMLQTTDLRHQQEWNWQKKMVGSHKAEIILLLRRSLVGILAASLKKCRPAIHTDPNYCPRHWQQAIKWWHCQVIVTATQARQEFQLRSGVGQAISTGSKLSIKTLENGNRQWALDLQISNFECCLVIHYHPRHAMHDNNLVGHQHSQRTQNVVICVLALRIIILICTVSGGEL